MDILYLYGSFSGMAKKYMAMHLGNFTDKELDNAKDDGERLESMLLNNSARINIKAGFFFSL